MIIVYLIITSLVIAFIGRVGYWSNTSHMYRPKWVELLLGDGLREFITLVLIYVGTLTFIIILPFFIL